MSTSRTRVYILGLLLFVYIAGVLLLSTLTLHDPRNIDFSLPFGKMEEISRKNSMDLEGISPFRRFKIDWCNGDLRYLQPPITPIALASFPGSGNTWLRYLLQQATGIYTGSIYKDYGLLKNGFPAENISNGSVLVVKTHEWGKSAREPYNKAILLVRAPGPAILAEFNRQSGGHIGFASPDRYKKLKGKFWKQFVTDKLAAWKQTNLDWLQNFDGPIHVIFYERLMAKCERTLKSLLEFIQVSVPTDILRCTIERREGIYRRRKRLQNFDPFTTEMKKLIDDEQQIVYDAIYNKKGGIPLPYM